MQVTLAIDGNNFNDYKGFVIEFSRLFGSTEVITSLSAIDDVLYGGVGGSDASDRVQFIWRNSSKSKSDLNNEFYVDWLLKA